MVRKCHSSKCKVHRDSVMKPYCRRLTDRRNVEGNSTEG